MKKRVKRFIIPAFFFLAAFLLVILIPGGEYTDTTGALSTLAIMVLFPLGIITLIWAIFGMFRDARLEKAGIEVDNTLFPSLGRMKDAVEKDREEGEALSSGLQQRRSRLRRDGVITLVLGLVVICSGLVVVGTLLIIGGLACFFMSSPDSYSKNVDGINMLECPAGLTLDQIYEDFKDYPTQMGSVFKGTTIPKRPCLFWGGEDATMLLYLYMNKAGNLLYIGSCANIGCKFQTQPLLPKKTADGLDFGDALCFNMEYCGLVDDLTEVVRQYLKDGTIRPLPEYDKGKVYYFEENFSLTGQRFSLLNPDKEPVLSAEGTMPLRTFRVFDPAGEEIFRVSKEIVSALPHYLFYEKGELIGEFSKEVNLVRDMFSMDTGAGRIEMREVNTLLGKNFIVLREGRKIGSIAEKLNLTLENIVFNNLVLVVYDSHDLPLMAALGVMAVREMARDSSED